MSGPAPFLILNTGRATRPLFLSRKLQVDQNQNIQYLRCITLKIIKNYTPLAEVSTEELSLQCLFICIN